MKKKTAQLFCLLMLAALPAAAKTKNTAAVTAPVSQPDAAPVSSSAPEPLGSAAVTAPPAASAAPPAAPAKPAKPGDLSPDKVTAGDMTLSGMSAQSSGGAVIISLTIRNSGKSDDRITGAGSWDGSDVAMAGDGKDKDAPVDIAVPAGDKVDVKLTVKNATSGQRNSGEVPLTLYFRRSPNMPVKLALSESAGSKLLNFFK